MELRMDYFCAYCHEQFCSIKNKPSEIHGCIYNIIIHEDESKILLYNLPTKSIYKISNGSGMKEISFPEAIREIDIIPTKGAEWKRFQILNLAKDLGFFGI